MNYSIIFLEIFIVLALLAGLVSMLWFVIASLLEEKVPVLTPGEYIFDYVVVGAGSSGSVVASLLSKHSKSTILLVEAGDRFGFLSKIPLLTTFQQKGVNDWSFLSTRQAHSSRGLEEERQCLPRGKGLGGSAQLNYMLHFDGYEGDFERWSRDFKLKGWDWLSFKPFLQAGNSKPFERLEITPDYSKIATAFHRASSAFEHRNWHFRKAQYNIKNGIRYNVYQRYLQKAYKQRNLRVMTNTLAKSIEFRMDTKKGKKVAVRSVRLATKDANTGKEFVFEVNVLRELIICAGAYQSPQLLQVSGLGNRTHLKEQQVRSEPFLPHLPMVGQNLHDHLNLPLYVSIDTVGPSLNQRALLSPWSILSYLTVGGGHLANFGVLGHVHNYAKNLSDIFGLTFFAAGAIDEAALMSISNFRKSYFRALFPRYYNSSQEGFVLISSCLQPLSRGEVQIQSSSIRRQPLINPNYLSDRRDIACTIKAVRAGIELVNSQPFSSLLGPQIHWPRIKECLNGVENEFILQGPSDKYLECLIRHVGLGSHHPGGTCRMGTNAQNSVVNAKFKVHGIENLRIIDGSVLPTPISGNPNSIIVGMAVRGAAMILKEEKKKTINN
ncbi:neither inactivation nor afterpotential protein G isoform X1 [Stomoxys calcitrans]|uniref:neither inactivation nor afterpotential protein G isoform X1 n=1 Tax=Stomoxys calcitrans TaxID=35570 RepID=UPI0027E28577|nr:neither inactivation nor afterpotential protein G isoform X1 [Stomoxys calcitrans]